MTERGIEFVDLHPSVADFRADLRAGLSRRPRSIPCKYFYDARGSALFERICEQPEYYLPAAEAEIMQAAVGEIAVRVGAGRRVLELGVGSGVKTRFLLQRLNAPAAYVSVDIDRDQLLRAARDLQAALPMLAVTAVCADFSEIGDTSRFLRGEGGAATAADVVFFPGSTIGNLEPADLPGFLAGVRSLAPSFLVGVDLKKDPAVLDAAYNDAAGVTAAFNLNLLERANREADGDIDASAFRHAAFYNAEAGRIEMHLECCRDTVAHVAGLELPLAAGERILTEHSYKYALDELRALAEASGFAVRGAWTDAGRRFTVQLWERQEQA